MAFLNVGSDGGGSCRIPAAFGGCFGYKPTFGKVPHFPASPFGTLANVGPMTRTVEAAAMMLRVIGRPGSSPRARARMRVCVCSCTCNRWGAAGLLLTSSSPRGAQTTVTTSRRRWRAMWTTGARWTTACRGCVWRLHRRSTTSRSTEKSPVPFCMQWRSSAAHLVRRGAGVCLCARGCVCACALRDACCK